MTDDEQTGIIRYNTDLFNPDTIERFADHYMQLLENCLKFPDVPIENQEILTQVERQKIHFDWQGEEEPIPESTGIHHLIETQALVSPKATAIRFMDEEISYQDLNHRADQLAARLISLGVGAEVVVGVSVPRSIEMMIGLLGILKSGGAYLPIDPEYPEERIQYIADDSGIEILITHNSVKHQFAEFGGQVLTIDALENDDPIGPPESGFQFKASRLRNLHLWLNRQTQGHRY